MDMIIDRFLKHIHDLPEQHKMLVSLGYTHDLITKHFETILAGYSITPSQYNVLRILQGMHPNPCSVFELRDMIVNKKSDVSRLVERLRKVGLVERTVYKTDRRRVDVIITRKGLDVLEQIIKNEEAKMFGPFFHLKQAEAKQLIALLQKLMEGMKAKL
jgi:MarR family multiple gene transcriptional regulator MgrA